MWAAIALISFLVLVSSLLFAFLGDSVEGPLKITPAAIAGLIAAVQVASKWLTPTLVAFAVGLWMALVEQIPLWARFVPFYLACLLMLFAVWKWEVGTTTIAFRVAISVMDVSLIIFFIVFSAGVDRDLTAVPVGVAAVSAFVAWFYWQRHARLNIRFVFFGGIITHFLHALLLLVPPTPLAAIVTSLPIALFYGFVLLYVVMNTTIPMVKIPDAPVFSIEEQAADELVPVDLSQ